MAKATIKTIAEEAGVSIATVSKALNDMPDVSEGVKVRIREIARRQGYVINAAARQLASGHTYSVGVILPDLGQRDIALVFSALSQRLQRAGYTLNLGITESDIKAEAAMAVDMLNKGVGLLVVYPATNEKRHIEEAVGGRLPVLYMGGAVNPNAENAVICDDYKGGMAAAEALYEGGCRSAAIFTWGDAATAQHERARGFMAFMQENGVSVRTYKSSEYLTEDTGRVMAREMLLEGPAAGVFATDDLIAMGALDVFQRAGLSVPEEIQLVGYGDAPFAGLGLIELTTVALPAKEMGICTSDLVLGLLGERTDVVRKMTLEPQLVRRASTRPPVRIER